MAKPDLMKVVANTASGFACAGVGRGDIQDALFKYGQGTLVAGTKTITDVDVKSTSTILVTDTTAANAIWAGSKSDGSFIVTGTNVDTFNYFVII
jgi:hypothetical protein